MSELFVWIVVGAMWCLLAIAGGIFYSRLIRLTETEIERSQRLQDCTVAGDTGTDIPARLHH